MKFSVMRIHWHPKILFHLVFPFLLIRFSLSPLWAEQILDVADPLSVAKNQAYLAVNQGHLNDALALEAKARKIAEDRWGPTHPSLSPILSDIATIDRHLGLFTDAEASLNWALALRVRAYGMDNPLVAESLNQLSSLYCDWGRWKDAEYFSNRARIILEKHKNPLRSLYATSLNKLGEIQLALGQISSSLHWLEQSQTFQEEKPNPDAGVYIQTLTLLSKAHLLNHHLPEAQSFLEKALETTQKRFPSDSIEVADALENLGSYLQAQNQSQSADPLLDSALKIYGRFMGDYFGYSNLPYAFRLARACQSVGNDKKALDLLTHCLETQKEIYGEKSLQVALTLLDKAKVEKAQRRTAFYQGCRRGFEPFGNLFQLRKYIDQKSPSS